MSDQYLGEIRTVGFNFAPQGWAFCNGQSVSITENQALFSLIGTSYGGDGQTNFNLPNLQSRLGVGSQNQAPGPGLTAYAPGQLAGADSVTLNTLHVPPHQHPFSATLAAASGGTPTTDPKGAYPGAGPSTAYAGAGGTNQYLDSSAVAGLAQPNPGSQAHSNIQPVLALNYIICLEGNYPPRQD